MRVPEVPGYGGFVPPCGHVAGVYAKSDERTGVHKAPANEILEGVLDLELDPGAAIQGELNPEGVNCLRAFPGRGIRDWGARTLSEGRAWRYVSVRRLFLTATMKGPRPLLAMTSSSAPGTSPMAASGMAIRL